MSVTEGKARIPLVLFYGQSWMAANSNNGRVLTGNPCPDHALMLDGEFGLISNNTVAADGQFGGFRPAVDRSPRVQTVVTPFLYRYALDALEDGRPARIAGYSAAVSGAGLAALLPAGDPRHKASLGFNNLMAAVRGHMAAAQALGCTGYVPFVVFCQGAGDRMMPEEDYAPLLADVLDRVQTGAAEITGQAARPHVLLVQPPGKAHGGAWPCLQAQVTLAAARADVTLAAAGWAVDQHDRIHFSGPGAVDLGELLAVTARALELGRPCGAPWLRRAARDATGAVLADIAGTGDTGLIVDTGPDSPRHRVGDATVPGFGFEFDRRDAAGVALDGHMARLRAPEGMSPKRLSYAMHQGPDRMTDRSDKANQSANRGNIRLAQSWVAKLSDRHLCQWLASGRVDITG